MDNADFSTSLNAEINDQSSTAQVPQATNTKKPQKEDTYIEDLPSDLTTEQRSNYEDTSNRISLHILGVAGSKSLAITGDL